MRGFRCIISDAVCSFLTMATIEPTNDQAASIRSMMMMYVAVCSSTLVKINQLPITLQIHRQYNGPAVLRLQVSLLIIASHTMYCKNCTRVMLLLIPSILRGNYWGESRSWLSSWCKTVSPICVTQWEVIIEVGRGVVKSSFITLHPVTLVEPRTPDRGLGPAQDWRASYQLVWGPILNPAHIWQL